MNLVCLLPVRNGERDLPGYLEAVAGVADAVVALDDGSTDATRDLLEASPLVRVVLTNPPRSTYAGWDDAANRQRLLDAAEPLSPDWVLFLDVDERLDSEDAAALRAFLGRDALRLFVYGLQHHRMWGADRSDPTFRWIYRLFAYRPGLELPADRLHFNPVPVDVPRSMWLRTTIRVRHLVSSSEELTAARLEKYAEADPEGTWPTDYAGLAGPPRESVAWERRPADLGVLFDPDVHRWPGELSVRIDRAEWLAGRGGPRLVCLLPARNAEDLLPGWFDAVRDLADAVVALDDGSTDGTRELLSSEPLVKVLLDNPRRASYRGWDDAANRQRLLEAAGELDPAFVLYLDADERIPSDDARALRRFVEEEAEPGRAYGFRVFRMLQDGAAFDRADLWVYRLFAFEPGQRLPDRRLHLVPVPTRIARERWLPTTIRIQHVSGVSDDRRRARYEKYREADPEQAFQASYENLLAPPDLPQPWEPRPPDLPVLTDARSAAPPPAADELDLDAPVLSAIVIARGDEARIEPVVRAVVEQEVPEPFEVIVVTSPGDRTAEIVRARFPDVVVVELAEPGYPGRARNAGLAVARGEYVSFPGSHVTLPPGSLAARVRAHELGYPMVTGSTLNGTRTPAGWASYFLDHATVLPGRPSQELLGSPAHCSYTREFLVRAGGFPEDMRAGEDTVVNFRLHRQGYLAYRAQDVHLVHQSPCSTPLRLVAHHFVRGRAMGRILLDATMGPDRGSVAGARTFLRGYVRRRVRAVDRAVERWGPELAPTLDRVRRLVTAGAIASWAGSWFEVMLRSRRPGPRSPRTGTPRPTTGAGAPGRRTAQAPRPE